MMPSFKIKIFLTILLSGFCSASFSLSPEFIQKNKKPAEPIYHTVKIHETLFSIAKKYNAKTTELKKWNKLKSDNVKVGQKLIVGYGKNKKGTEVKKVHKEVPKKNIPVPQSVTKKQEPEIVKQIQQVQKKEEP